MNAHSAKVATNPAWGTTPIHRIDVARYTSAEHVALERERLWPYAWLMACREEELPNPGDYLEYQIADQSIVVVRTASGKLKAYFNACMHRGTQFAKGCGNVKQFACPFHGWRWSLDGENQYVHDRADFPGLKAEDIRLQEAQIASWGGFVFLKLTEGGPSFEDFLGPDVAEHLAPYRLEEYRITSWRSSVIKANWKVALEAFEEAYHLMVTHPQLILGVDDVNTKYDVFGPHSRLISRSALASPRFEDATEDMVLEHIIEGLVGIDCADDQDVEALQRMRETVLPEGMTTRQWFINMGMERYAKFMPGMPAERFGDDWDYTIFPNLVFNLYPGSLFGFNARPNGADPDTCIFDIISLQHPAGEQKPPAKRETITDPNYDWGTVISQDLSNLARIQDGMHSRSMKQSRLAGYQEMRIANRHKYIDEYYAKYGK